MQHLDYLSCLLTICSTVLVGRRMWQGWIVAGINSVIISFIGLHTAQWGFVPANVFCLVIYAYNLKRWREPAGAAAGAVVVQLGKPTTETRRHGGAEKKIASSMQ